MTPFRKWTRPYRTTSPKAKTISDLSPLEESKQKRSATMTTFLNLLLKMRIRKKKMPKNFRRCIPCMIIWTICKLRKGWLWIIKFEIKTCRIGLRMLGRQFCPWLSQLSISAIHLTRLSSSMFWRTKSINRSNRCVNLKTVETKFICTSSRTKKSLGNLETKCLKSATSTKSHLTPWDCLSNRTIILSRLIGRVRWSSCIQLWFSRRFKILQRLTLRFWIQSQKSSPRLVYISKNPC